MTCCEVILVATTTNKDNGTGADSAAAAVAVAADSYFAKTKYAHRREPRRAEYEKSRSCFWSDSIDRSIDLDWLVGCGSSMSEYNLHVLCVAAYNILGVPEDQSYVTWRGSESRVFKKEDIGSVFWVGNSVIYVRGSMRRVESQPVSWIPTGTIGLVLGVESDVQTNVVSIVYLSSSSRGRVSTFLNPLSAT